jgi:NADH-quinone oxidoreductase subunit C
VKPELHTVAAVSGSSAGVVGKQAPDPQTLLPLLQEKMGSTVKAHSVDLGTVVVVVGHSDLRTFLGRLKDDPDLRFDLFLSVTAVDWMDLREDRFDVVYHLMSLRNLWRIRIKVAVSEDDPELDTVSDLWLGANFMEREVYDMFGVRFRGHPDLRRTLLYDEFVGHPLRKDYPVQAKQPRIPLLNPEVRNTSLDMSRPALVQINKRAGQKSLNRGTTR